MLCIELGRYALQLVQATSSVLTRLVARVGQKHCRNAQACDGQQAHLVMPPCRPLPPSPLQRVRDSIMADIDAGALPPWTMSYIKHAAQVPGAPEKGPWTRLEDGREVAPEALIFAPRRMRIEHMAVQSKACIIRGSMGG